MLQGGVLPAWCKQAVVVAAAAYPSRAHLPASQARGWFFVLAFPRTWKLANGHYLRDIVTHLPIHPYPPVRVPLVVPNPHRRVCWTCAQQAQVAHGGEVTGVLRRRRRNESPKHTKLLVPTLPQATAHLTVALYLSRWPVDLWIKDLQSAVGLGPPHVTKDGARGERAVAVAGRASLLWLRLRANQSQPGRSWRAFTLKHELAWEWGTHQLLRTVRPEARKEIRRHQAAAPPPVRLAA
jgi:hypothetical protein